MTRFFSALVLLVLVLSLTACGDPAPQKQMQPEATPESTNSSDGLVDITEKMYVTYINDIYTNLGDYLGKKIRIQGMFAAQVDDTTQKTYFYVYRVGPGCCGNDGAMCGFEFTLPDAPPNQNDWIEVVGILDSYTEEGTTYPVLRAQSVKVLPTRGSETVYQ